MANVTVQNHWATDDFDRTPLMIPVPYTDVVDSVTHLVKSKHHQAEAPTEVVADAE